MTPGVYFPGERPDIEASPGREPMRDLNRAIWHGRKL